MPGRADSRCNYTNIVQRKFKFPQGLHHVDSRRSPSELMWRRFVNVAHLFRGEAFVLSVFRLPSSVFRLLSVFRLPSSSCHSYCSFSTTKILGSVDPSYIRIRSCRASAASNSRDATSSSPQILRDTCLRFPPSNATSASARPCPRETQVLALRLCCDDRSRPHSLVDGRVSSAQFDEGLEKRIRFRDCKISSHQRRDLAAPLFRLHPSPRRGFR